MSENCVRYVEGKFWLNDSGFSVKVKESKKNTIQYKYLENILLNIQESIYKCGRGIAQKNIDFEKFKNISIPVLDWDKQGELVRELQQQNESIEKQKKVIETFEQKIKDMVNSLWENK